MEWLLKSLRGRSDAINSELDVWHFYKTQWLEEYNNLKQEKKELTQELNRIDNDYDFNIARARINELTSLLKKDQNAFLKNKKKRLFEQESIPAEPIKSWRQLAEKRRRERAAQLVEDARMAEDFRQEVGDIVGVDLAPHHQIEEDPEDRRARLMMEALDRRERAAHRDREMGELAEQERAVRIARQDEERLQQIATAQRLADELAHRMALQHGTDGLGSGEHKRTKKKSTRRRKPKTSKHKKKKNNKSRSSRKK